MKNFFKLMSVALVVAMGTVMTSCSSNGDSNPAVTNDPYVQNWQGKTAKYTIMFYGCGGGDVDAQLDGAIDYVKESLKVPQNQVRFVVMYSNSKDDSKLRDPQKPNEPVNLLYGKYGCTYRYELTPNINSQSYHYRCYYKPASEVELYRVETIKEFINWAKQTAPAENYILMPVNHGGGFDLDEETPTRAIAYDDNHGEKGVSTKAFAQALAETGTHLKAIYWYGCLMGQLEVMTEVAPYCDYQFCSSHVARVNPRHVYAIVDAINSYPDDFEDAISCHLGIMTSPSGNLNYADINFVEEFQNVEDEKTKEIKNENCDFGCWRSAGIAAINAQVEKLVKVLTNGYADSGTRTKIDNATKGVYLFGDLYVYADVLHYAQLVHSNLNTPETQSIFEDLAKAIKAANVYHISGFHKTIQVGDVTYGQWPSYNGADYYSLGISIYSKDHPIWTKYHDAYQASTFDKVTGWSKFIFMNTPTVSPTTNPANDSGVDEYWMDDEQEGDE